MTNDDNSTNGSSGPEAEQPPQAEAKPSSPPPPSTPEEKLAAAQAEANRYKDQLLRTAADFDNFRKRARREQDDANRRGRESTVKDLLPVFDNLERAAQSAEGSTDVKAVADGIRIVLKQFVDTLDRMNIKRVATVGKAFDPAVHEAVQHMASPDHPAGVIVAEVQPGYTIGDYLLRAALVVVSKGSPEGSAAN